MYVFSSWNIHDLPLPQNVDNTLKSDRLALNLCHEADQNRKQTIMEFIFNIPLKLADFIADFSHHVVLENIELLNWKLENSNNYSIF
jgi:hypothetical protein